MAYLPLLPATKKRVNAYLLGMAAWGFGVTETMLFGVCRTTPQDFEGTE